MHGACGCIHVVGQVEIVSKMKAVNVFVLKMQRPSGTYFIRETYMKWEVSVTKRLVVEGSDAA